MSLYILIYLDTSIITPCVRPFSQYFFFNELISCFELYYCLFQNSGQKQGSCIIESQFLKKIFIIYLCFTLLQAGIYYSRIIIPSYCFSFLCLSNRQLYRIGSRMIFLFVEPNYATLINTLYSRSQQIMLFNII